MTISTEDRNALVVKYLPLARKLARRNAPYNKAHQDDLYQEGALALMRAAELYDPTRGCSFFTYAYRRIWADVIRQAPELYSVVSRRNARETKVRADGTKYAAVVKVAHSDSEPDLERVGDSTEGPEALAHRARLAQRVADAVNRVPLSAAETVILNERLYRADGHEALTMDAVATKIIKHKDRSGPTTMSRQGVAYTETRLKAKLKTALRAYSKEVA